MRDQTKEHFEKSVSTSIDALHDRRRVVQSLNSLDEMLDRVQKAKKENHKTAFGMSFKQRGEAFASDPFLAVKARKHAVVRSETEEVDRRIAEARGETEELISKIKSLDAEEEKYDKEKSELGRLLNVLNEATRNIPQDEMSVVQSELNLKPNSPTNHILREGVIEGRLTSTPIDYEAYTVHWSLENKLDLIFVIAYSKMIQLNYVEELIETTKQLFVSLFKPLIEQLVNSLSGGEPLNQMESIPSLFKGWDSVFDKLLKDIDSNKKQRAKLQNNKKAAKSTPKVEQGETQSTEKVVDANEIAKNVEAMKARLKASSNTKKAKAAPAADQNTKKSKKEMRNWGNKVTSQEMSALDFSSTSNDSDNVGNLDNLVDKSAKGTYDESTGVYNLAEYNNDDEDEDLLDIDIPALETEQPQQDSTWGFLKGLTGLTGGKTIDKATIQPVLANMSMLLMKKNVAAEISEKVCASVEQQLVGRKIGTFTTIKSEVKNALNNSITRILTPKTSTDILFEISQKKKKASSKGGNDPYSLVFCGVNGVGKSTNLSKVCYWLLENRLNVLIAACDTFRSGAVEQLRTHVNNLDNLKLGSGVTSRIELYERGYGKDAAGIARDAIAYGKENKFDVVLIDTAGRMQDNEPLMRALAKLVSVNKPDKIIFVGEALVGNEATDQLVKFDRALKDLSSSAAVYGRGIDGMLLTKFDTIDDKVGAALSMTYITGQPIFFVGCGQTYTDLRQLRVPHIVQALLKA
ncbi:P-loop containing nucleoside triphosphate hydrolase protein [Wallemia mellicola]|nr:P-loop containing nucleoside triphosphate hydrolase protein [Wallemia mellicola]